MAQEALAQQVHLLGALAQPQAQAQHQVPTKAAPDPVAKVVAEDGPRRRRHDHANEGHLATAGGIAPQQGEGLARQGQAGVLQQHAGKNHPIAPAAKQLNQVLATEFHADNLGAWPDPMGPAGRQGGPGIGDRPWPMEVSPSGIAELVQTTRPGRRQAWAKRQGSWSRRWLVGMVGPEGLPAAGSSWAVLSRAWRRRRAPCRDMSRGTQMRSRR